MQFGTYQNIRGHLHFLKDSYRGGYHYSNPAQSTLASVEIFETDILDDGTLNKISRGTYRSYLTPYDGESASSFGSRAKSACYINLVQPVVSAYVDSVLAKKVQRSFGKLEEHIPEDVDFQGSSYEEFIKHLATEVAIYGFSFVFTDVNPENPTKLRFVLIDPTKVEFVVVDDFGKIVDFAFVSESEVPNATAPAVQNITLIQINSSGIHTLKGTVDYDKGYDIRKLEKVNSIELAPGLQGKLPISVCYYKKDTSSILPLGISLIETQAAIGKEVYNLQSYSQDILRMHFPQLTYPIKTTGGSLTPEAQKGMGTKVALTYDSETNAPAYISPSKDSTEALKAQSDWLIDKAMAAAYLDLNSSAGVNSSGFALTIKSREFENAVKNFALELTKFEQKLLLTAVEILGIQGDPEVEIKYPDKFIPNDLSSALQTAKSVLDLSKEYDIGTFAKESALIFIITNALGLSEEQTTEVIKEIKAKNKQVQPSLPTQEPSTGS